MSSYFTLILHRDKCSVLTSIFVLQCYSVTVILKIISVVLMCVMDGHKQYIIILRHVDQRTSLNDLSTINNINFGKGTSVKSLIF